jgi:hypothetical protein
MLIRAPIIQLSHRSVTMPFSFDDLLAAFEFVSAGGAGGENQAFLCRQTGKIYWRSEDADLGEFDDPLPDDLEENEKYIAMPDRQELGLGKPLVLDFACQFLPNDFDEVRYIFSKRGALFEIQSLAGAAKCPRSLVRVRTEGNRTRLARLVRAQRDSRR